MLTKLVTLSVILGAISLGFLHRDAPRVTPELIKANNGKYVQLNDGRLLEYMECPQPSSVPSSIVALHFPGYGNGAGAITTDPDICALYSERSIRVIEPSLPGFGYSDSLPLSRQPRVLDDWANDVKQLLDHVAPSSSSSSSSRQVLIMGSSFGCMHAVSVAAAMERSEVLGVALYSPTMPVEYEPQIEHLGIAPATKLIRILLSTQYIGEFIAYAMSHVSPDTRMNAAPDVKRALERMDSEPQHQVRARRIRFNTHRASVHSFRGWHDNMRVLMAPWAHLVKRMEQQELKNVVITSADDDTTNPKEMQTWLHQHLRGSVLLKVPSGWGHMHLALPETHDQVLKKMVFTNNK